MGSRKQKNEGENSVHTRTAKFSNSIDLLPVICCLLYGENRPPVFYARTDGSVVKPCLPLERSGFDSRPVHRVSESRVKMRVPVLLTSWSLGRLPNTEKFKCQGKQTNV